MSTGSSTIPASQSEDCLYLAVYAPSSAKVTSKLPVFVFIQGGGFNSDANPNLNGTGLIQASDSNIVVVTFNYRVGPWGFLASSSSETGVPTANNGLLDQRKVFEWVQNNIAAFGGDPGHVTIGGDSAGAASVSLHLTAYGGRNDDLFHAAAAESVSFATVLTVDEAQYQYDNFTHAAGCDSSNATQSLSCLRSKSASDLEAQNFNVPYPGQNKAPLYMFGPTIDGSIIQDLTYTAFQTGKFIDVPVIIGDDTNGGTIFTPKTTANQQESNDFLTQQFPYITQSELTEIAELYPVPTGSDCPPSGTCWWRQVSNAYGDMRYKCPGLYISSAYANLTLSSKKHSRSSVGGGSARRAPINTLLPRTNSKSASYAYLYNVDDPDQIAQGLGVPHTVELNAIFGPDNVPAGSAPASYYPGKSNAQVVPVIQAYWTSFIRAYNPNTYKLKGSATWQTYYDSNGQPQRLLFSTGGGTSMEVVDATKRVQCAYFESFGASIKQK